MKVHKGILGGQSFELVWCGSELITSFISQVLCNLFCEADVSIETSTYSSATLSQLIHISQGLFDTSFAICELVNISRELLPEGQRCRILSVCPANLHDMIEVSTFLVQNVGQGSELGQKTLVDLQDSGDMHH